MKTSELTGALLDYWVAMAEGREPRSVKIGDREVYALDFGKGFEVPFYSTDWARGGPIIERECIHITMEFGTAAERKWKAIQMLDEMMLYGLPSTTIPAPLYGPTPLIAAMRAYVTSKFGNEVQAEGASEQDAKDARIARLRAALQEISETQFGSEGDCGTARIAGDALWADECSVIMSAAPTP